MQVWHEASSQHAIPFSLFGGPASDLHTGSKAKHSQSLCQLLIHLFPIFGVSPCLSLSHCVNSPSPSPSPIPSPSQWRAYSAAQRKLHSILRTGNELQALPHQREYMRHQHFIGWRALLEGRLAVSWGWAQQQYWLRDGSVKSVRRWTAALITRLLLISWDFWDHRNHILHGSEGSLAEYMVDSRISTLYSAGPWSLPAYCLPLFSGTLPALLCHPPFQARLVVDD
jgi:hypothetical protein